jgi:hypothetical protein
MTDNDYEMGQISARLDTSDERHEENKARLDAIESTLKELVSAITLAKGGIRMLLAIVAVAASFGAVVHLIVKWFEEHLK